MLYDTRWDAPAETKADPFKTETMIAWLEKQPADERYDYCNPFECLVAQYLQAHGLSRAEVGLNTNDLFSLGWLDIASGHPRTFGAALARAKGARRFR